MSSRIACTGAKLSLSLLRQTAAEVAFGAAKNPVTSAPTPIRIGAVRSDPGVAGPLEEKLAGFSSWFEDWVVCTSWKWAPTETRFFAVAGGEIWIGRGWFGSLSPALPSNRSGYWFGLSPPPAWNDSGTAVPSLPTGTKTM